MDLEPRMTGDTPTHPTVILQRILEKSRRRHRYELECLKLQIFVHYADGNIPPEVAEDLLSEEFIAERTEVSEKLGDLLDEPTLTEHHEEQVEELLLRLHPLARERTTT